MRENKGTTMPERDNVTTEIKKLRTLLIESNKEATKLRAENEELKAQLDRLHTVHNNLFSKLQDFQRGLDIEWLDS